MNLRDLFPCSLPHLYRRRGRWAVVAGSDVDVGLYRKAIEWAHKRNRGSVEWMIA